MNRKKTRASVGTHAETVMADRRRRVAALYLRGDSQYEIARAVGVNQGTISRDLEAVRAEWLAAAVRDFDARRAEELARLDALETEAWAAWERSRAPAETTTAEKAETADGTRSKASKRVEGRDGDPRFLQVVERCIARRCELLGLDEPQKHQLAGQIAQTHIYLPPKNDPPN